MISIIIGSHSRELQAYPILFFQAGATKSVARGIGSSIGGSSPICHQSR